MKRLFIISTVFVLILLPLRIAWGFGIVNNSGSAAADSLSIPFYALDSTGNIVAMAAGDSVFLYTFYPSGTLAFEDSAAYNGTKITAKTRHGVSVYSWKDAAANLDGTAVQGVYSYLLFVKDLTGAALQTPHTGTFQLLTETDFYLSIEYIKDILDSLQNHDNWVATQTSAADAATKSGNCLDSLQAQDGWVAKEAGNVQDALDSIKLYDTRLDSLLAAATNASFLVKIWGDTSNTPGERERLLIISGDSANWASIVDVWNVGLASLVTDSVGDVILDSLFAILDSLQAQDGWIAKEAGNVKAALDSLKLYSGRLDSLLAAASNASFLSKIWNLAFTTAFTAGSIGDSLTTASYVQGSGSSIAQEALDSLKSQDNWIIAKMDSILLIGGNDAGAFMHTATAATRDTAYYGIGNDTLFYEVFWHLTGVAGDDPDSSRVYAH